MSTPPTYGVLVHLILPPTQEKLDWHNACGAPHDMVSDDITGSTDTDRTTCVACRKTRDFARANEIGSSLSIVDPKKLM